MEPARRQTELIAHRGAPREFRENTLPAFERALERGADAIELDVHVTADGVVVVHHDPVLTSTVSGVLRDRAIDSLPWTELETVELTPGVTLPTLAQVLDLVGHRATVYVEIKGAGIERLVAEAIGRSDARCAMHSFDHQLIARARHEAPEIPRGILYDEYPADLERDMRATGARDVWPNQQHVDRALVDAVHRLGGRVLVWTVNDAATAERLTDMGVDGLCGDDLRILGH